MGTVLAGPKVYSHQVFNENGLVLLYPEIRPEDEVLQGHPPNMLAESANQEFPLGTKALQGDRVWRYSKNSSAAITVVGKVMQGPAGVHADVEDDIVVAASTGATYAIGSYDISLVSTSNIAAAPWSTANGGKEGYVYVNGGVGIGMCRKIKTHEAFSSTDDTLITVYEPWTVAPIAANTECGIAENQYSNVVVAAAQATLGPAPPIGVATIAITASYYFWAQSGGPCAVTCAAAIAHSTMAVVGTTAGEIDPFSAFTTEYIIGFPITPGIKNDDTALMFLTIDR